MARGFSNELVVCCTVAEIQCGHCPIGCSRRPAAAAATRRCGAGRQRRNWREEAGGRTGAPRRELHARTEEQLDWCMVDEARVMRIGLYGLCPAQRKGLQSEGRDIGNDWFAAMPPLEPSGSSSRWLWKIKKAYLNGTTMTITMITRIPATKRWLALRPECLGPWALPVWREKKTRSMQNKSNLRSDLLPLEVRWACICARKELRFTQDECRGRE